jgi:hypothetical protein
MRDPHIHRSKAPPPTGAVAPLCLAVVKSGNGRPRAKVDKLSRLPGQVP